MTTTPSQPPPAADLGASAATPGDPFYGSDPEYWELIDGPSPADVVVNRVFAESLGYVQYLCALESFADILDKKPEVMVDEIRVTSKAEIDAWHEGKWCDHWAETNHATVAVEVLVPVNGLEVGEFVRMEPDNARAAVAAGYVREVTLDYIKRKTAEQDKCLANRGEVSNKARR